MSDPANTVAPTLTYTNQAILPPIVGQNITCDGGTWTTTIPPIGLQYSWTRVGVGTVASVTGPTYPVTTADVGHGIRCSVTAIRADGANTTVNSNTTSGCNASTGGGPEIGDQGPTLSSPIGVGNAVTCNTGTWLGQPPFTYFFQWEKLAGGTWTRIVGAINQTYTPVAADAGLQLHCIVNGMNAISGVGTIAVSNSVIVDTPTPLTAPVSSVRHQRRGQKWFKDIDGIWSTEKQYEDIDVDIQDWSDALNGESIASTAWNTDGIIINSSSSTDTTTTVTVTGVGSCHVDITTSGGRTVREYFRWRRLHRPILGTLGGGSTLPGEDYGP